jgi:hypothetical protein
MKKDILSFIPIATLIAGSLFVLSSFDTSEGELSLGPIYAGFLALMLMPISGLLIFLGIGKVKYKLMYHINQIILLAGCAVSIYLWSSLK